MGPQSKLARETWALVEQGLKALETAAEQAAELLEFGKQSPDAGSMLSLTLFVEAVVPQARKLAQHLYNGGTVSDGDPTGDDSHQSRGDDRQHDAGGKNETAERGERDTDVIGAGRGSPAGESGRRVVPGHAG